MKWRSIRIHDHPSINIHDTLNPEKGLTSPRIDGVLPFIRLPRSQSLLIMGQVGQDKIFRHTVVETDFPSVQMLGTLYRQLIHFSLRLLGNHGRSVYECKWTFEHAADR